MLNLVVKFSVLRAGVLKEDFEARLEDWIETMRERGYKFPIIQITETLKYEEDE